MNGVFSDNGISSMEMERVAEALADMGQPAYRAKQVFRWLHARGADSFEGMSDLPAALRRELAGRFVIERPAIIAKETSRDGTCKMLLECADGCCVESVLMQHRHGNSLCVSSQVGCRMGCRFCASGKNGLERGLTAGEMAGQLYAAASLGGERISHVVLMGIGEPLDNFDAVMGFIDLVTHKEGHNLSMRNITLSTCGVVPGILRLAEHRLPITLSVSLHAPFDETRSEMMPVNNAWCIEELMQACREYAETTGRRVSFEYALVRGLNDSARDAVRLAELLRPTGSHLNLIAVNPVNGAPFAAADRNALTAFREKMLNLGVNTTIRRRLGSDISAACGQLRMRRMDQP